MGTHLCGSCFTATNEHSDACFDGREKFVSRSDVTHWDGSVGPRVAGWARMHRWDLEVLRVMCDRGTPFVFGGVTITDLTLDESGRFEVHPSYYERS